MEYLASGLFVGVAVGTYLAARGVKLSLRPGPPVIGALGAAATAVLLLVCASALMPAWAAVVTVVVLVALALLWLIDIGGRRRLSTLTAAAVHVPQAVGLPLAALPIHTSYVLHPRRRGSEPGSCECLACTSFGTFAPRDRVTVAVSPTELSLWRGDRGAVELTGTLRLGFVRGIVLRRQGISLLSPFGSYTRDADNMSVSIGRRGDTDDLPAILGGNRDVFVLNLADSSAAVVAVEPRHNTRLFVDVVTRLLDDIELRLLAVLARDGRADADELRLIAGRRVATAVRKLARMAHEDLITAGPPEDSDELPSWARITAEGRRALSDGIAALSAVARAVVVEPGDRDR
ncbi:hypothetical protein AB0J86_30210 [Micromonospora sp. NPDC049559]|uniref:hypothetical protein n=1 Tax=Micromonospora sp. NPDC049559 TaxID=3155923 RepID=UPI00341EA615